MKYGIYAFIFALLFGAGIYCGFRFSTGKVIRDVVEPTVSTEVERTIIKTPEGRTETRIVERKVVQPAPAVKVSAQYRLGALLPIGEVDYKAARVQIGRRLVGNIWIEAQYDFKHKEALAGLSYEF